MENLGLKIFYTDLPLISFLYENDSVLPSDLRFVRIFYSFKLRTNRLTDQYFFSTIPFTIKLRYFNNYYLLDIKIEFAIAV